KTEDMMKHFNRLVFYTIAAGMVLAVSCKKADNKPSNNNNNNNNGNTNPDAPSISVYQPAADTIVPPSFPFTVKIRVIASASANVDSITGKVTELGHKYKLVMWNLTHGGTISYTKDTEVLDVWQLPTSTPKTIHLVYTVYGKGKSNTITRVITVAIPPVFKYWKVPLYDQNVNGNNAFLNTGGNPIPGYYSTGDVGIGSGDTSLRRLVDMCCVHTAGQLEVIISPGWVKPGITFADDSNVFNISQGWLLSQRSVTLFKRLAKNLIADPSNTNFNSYDKVEAAYKAAAGSGSPRVQYNFQPGDNYAFLTRDGRYGAFTFNGYLTNGVQLTMILESR
ncbi:MAG: hypothetical protein ACHQF4_11740, partial [Sphingobacteriales bacterium]